MNTAEKEPHATHALIMDPLTAYLMATLQKVDYWKGYA
jgi:hypothetical protein